MPKRDNGGVWVATEVRQPKREAYRTVDGVEIRHASDTVGMNFQRRHRRCVDPGEKVVETLPESLQARNRDEYGSEAEFLEARDRWMRCSRCGASQGTHSFGSPSWSGRATSERVQPVSS